MSVLLFIILILLFLMVFVQYRKGTTKGLIVSFLFISSCASMLQNKGQVYYDSSIYFNEKAFEKGWQSIENRLREWNDGRSNDSSFENESIEQYQTNNYKGGERKMEDMNMLVSSIGSAITAIYVLVKTIIGIIVKMKKN